MDIQPLLERTLSIQLDNADNATHRIQSIQCKVGDTLNPRQPLAFLERSRSTGPDTTETSKKPIYFSPKQSYKSPQITSILVQEEQALHGSSCAILGYSVEKSFANLIETLVPLFVQDPSNLYFLNKLPKEKVNDAINSYAKNVDLTKVIFFYDSTFWGNFWDKNKEGFILTDSGFYLRKAGLSFSFKFNDIQEVELCDTSSVDSADKTVKITLKNNEILYIEEKYEIQLPDFYQFLKIILDIRDQGLTNDVDEYIILEDMPELVKLNYISLLVWLTYQDDETIDPQELIKLQLLMTQVNCNTAIRSAVLQRISSPESLNLTQLAQELLEQAPKGCEQVLGISLLKDAIQVHRSTKKTTAVNQSSIQTLAQLVSINTAQLKFIEEACIQDERILAGEISDDEFTKAAKELAAKAGAVGVPVAAVYLSGSVVGLSAAGVTSGLATLGLGGILGLSSMVTGIGVAIGLGLGIYQGAQWLMGGAAEKDKRSRRDIMLQEVLTIHRKAIANLAEDIAYLAKQLVTLTADVERNQAVIQKLSRELTIFANAMQQMRVREQNFEQDIKTTAHTE